LVGGEFSDGSWSDCLTYGTLLNDVALIVDMLWYYPSADTVALAAQLDILARWAYEFMREENNYAGYWAFTDNPDYPDSLRTLWHNGRIRLAGALGYAGCVLGNNDFIEAAEFDLFERDLPGGKYGFLDFQTSQSGVYNEGMSYTEYVMEGLSKFFTARKRMVDGIDWFDDDRVQSIYENSLDLISPSMSLVPFDDVHEARMRGNDGYLYQPRNMFSEALTYYYQSPPNETESRAHIKWFINCYKLHDGYEDNYTPNINTN